MKKDLSEAEKTRDDALKDVEQLHSIVEELKRDLEQANKRDNKPAQNSPMDPKTLDLQDEVHRLKRIQQAIVYSILINSSAK